MFDVVILRGLIKTPADAELVVGDNLASKIKNGAKGRQNVEIPELGDHASKLFFARTASGHGRLLVMKTCDRGR
jgi:hypothetical protein